MSWKLECKSKSCGLSNGISISDLEDRFSCMKPF